MKKTKHALLLSAVSMLLCLSMLVGSTFAWFTDTASTGVNKIVAGNLDMKVMYINATGAAKEISEDAKDLFVQEDGSAILWEPGVVSVCYLAVENHGSLAFEYKLSVNYQDTVTYRPSEEAETVKLSNALQSAIIEQIPEENESSPAMFANREAALAAVGENGKALGYQDEEPGIALKSGEKKYFALVVWMPTTVGNTYNLPSNVPALEVQLGVNVVATQTPFEKDSFDENYDLNALYPASAHTTFDPEKETVIKGLNINAKAPKGTNFTTEDGEPVEEGAELILSVNPSVADGNFTVETDATDKVDTFEVTLKTADGKKVSADRDLEVTMNVGAGRSGAIQLYHRNDPIDSTYAATGDLTFTTSNFSPFTVVEDVFTPGEVISDATAKNVLDRGGVVDFNGAVMNKGDNLREYTFKAGTTVKNLTLKGSNATRWLHTYGGDVVFENCVFDALVYGCHFDSTKGEPEIANVAFKNCKFVGWNSFGRNFTAVSFENCEFSHSGSYGRVRFYQDGQFINCTFNKDMCVDAGMDEVTITFTNCTGVDNVNFDGKGTIVK